MKHMQIECWDRQEAPLPEEITATWLAVATHTHNIRSGECTPTEAADGLISWCQHHRIAAVGLGSPWEPVSRASYQRYEGVDRDRYYADDFDPSSVMDAEAIAAYFGAMNRRTAGSPLFYQDNETPKCRYGHLWWFGYHYDVPAWHDYSQDRPIWYHDGDSQCEINPLTGRPHTRRAYLEIVAQQRSRGALGVWAHPTSWWTQQRDDADQFVTNIAAECVQHLWIDGRLDGLAVTGYNAFRPQYQSLWYHLLDTGAEVPGFAETDTCFDRANLLDDARAYTNWLHMPSGCTPDAIVAAARAGACVFGTGGLLILAADGVGPGGRVETATSRTHQLVLQVLPPPGQTCYSRIELVGPGGAVLWTGERVKEGVLRFHMTGSSRPGYIVARGWGEHDDPSGGAFSAVVDHTVCNPIYLRPRDFHLLPMRTQASFTITPDSPWRGGTMQLEDAEGRLLDTVDLRYADDYRQVLPANARVRLQHPGQRERLFYLLMENPKAQALSRYLYDGWFRRDFPDRRPGDVPPEAFHVDATREALERIHKVL